ENVVISNGGYAKIYDLVYNGGAVRVEDSAVSFNNVVLKDNPKAIGIYLKNSTSTVSNSRFENNDIGLKIEGDIKPILDNNYFADNLKTDIYWPDGGGTCKALATTSAFSIECNCCPY
ncbi:MAG: right-handed parallel beta-helix repeat-containing protein, partial [Candidatus Nealsonbacteria bacterium]